MSHERQSVATEPEIITDPEMLAEREAANALRQFDMTLDFIDEHVRGQRPFRPKISTILTLHRAALEGIKRSAGTFRAGGVAIEGSGHVPPLPHLVPAQVEDMCEWIESRWMTASAIRLCAYAMWRLNWIHPFDDGNGRTSRAFSYLVLCTRAGDRLPGSLTIPEQIAQNKAPYYDALENADGSSNLDEPDLSKLESLLETCLAAQLTSAFNAATAAEAASSSDRRFH